MITFSKTLKSAAGGGIASAIVSGAVAAFLLGMPTDTAQNVVNNGMSGFFSGFFGAFFALRALAPRKSVTEAQV